jgi:hypothetical protein
MSTITRRSALTAGAAALATGTAISLPAIAKAPDPIYAIIDAWVSAYAHNGEVLNIIAQLETSLPKGRQTWHYVHGEHEPSADCPDDPAWIAAQIALNQSYREWERIFIGLLTTTPTTIGGLIALLNTVGATMSGEPYPWEKYRDEEPLRRRLEQRRGRGSSSPLSTISRHCHRFGNAVKTSRLASSAILAKTRRPVHSRAVSI